MNINFFKSKHNYRAFYSALKTIALLSFFYFISRIIAPTKGLDFSDEGFYLLSSDSSEPTDASGWPFGWNLNLLYRISGFSISNFRVYGFILLLLVNYRFSKTLFESLKFIVNYSFSKLEKFSFQILVTSSSILYYAGFLRSPGYNWLNVIGLTVFLNGTLKLISNLYKPSTRRSYELFYILEIAFGLFIALPAKPSTIGFGVTTLFLSILVITDFKLALKISIQVLILVFSFVFLAIISHFWPSTLLNQIAQALGSPQLHPNQTIFGAILDMAIISPARALVSFMVFPESTFLFAALIMCWLYRFPKFKVFNRQYLFLMAFWATLLSLAIHFLLRRDFHGSLRQKQFWLENSLISNSFLILILIFAFYGITQVKKTDFSKKGLKTLITFPKLIYLNLLFALFAIGFGSSSGIFGKLPLGTSLLMAILALQIMSMVNNPRNRTSILLALNFFIILVISVVFVGSYNNPYRSAGLSQMTQTVSIGNHNSTILLDQKTANQITELRSAAAGAGFLKSTPTINLIYPSGVGYGYALGGRQIPTIIFAWFGYPESLSTAKYNVSKSIGRFDFPASWILKSNDLQYGSEFSSFQNLIQYLQSRTVIKFPEEYELVYKDSELELWKPKSK